MLLRNNRRIKMAQSNAERQRAYRTRHLKDENGKGERLNILLDLHAKRALERLATCYGVTQKAILESILRQAENAALDKAAEFPNGQPIITTGS
jgi:hypothetical protein